MLLSTRKNHSKFFILLFLMIYQLFLVRLWRFTVFFCETSLMTKSVLVGIVLYLCSFFDKCSMWTRIIKLRRYVVFKVHFMASQFPKLRYSRRKIVFYLIQYKNITREIFYSKNHAENEEPLRLLNQRFTKFWFLRKGSENSFLHKSISHAVFY